MKEVPSADARKECYRFSVRLLWRAAGLFSKAAAAGDSPQEQYACRTSYKGLVVISYMWHRHR